jgi:Na+/glutamate symporter
MVILGSGVMSYKLWVVKICIALSVLVLLVVSLIVFYKAFAEWSILWEWYLLSVLLQIIAGFLLGVPPEVLVNLRKTRFSPKDFVVLVIIPIVLLVYISGYFNRYWRLLDWLYPAYFFYVPIASIWLGVAVGKALRVEEENRERTTTIPDSVKVD